MVSPVLLVSPDSGSLRKALRRLGDGPFSWAYLGQSVVEFHRVKRCSQSHGTYIATADRFHQAADFLREPYLEHVFWIGRELKSLLWWITPLSYRNGYVSKTFHRVCYLKVALDLIDGWEGPEPLVLVVEKPVHRALIRNLPPESEAKVRIPGGRRLPLLGFLRDVIRMAARRTLFIYQEGYRLLQSRLSRPGPPAPDDLTTLLISYGTSSNLELGSEFHRSYFGDLALQLGRLGHRVAVVPMLVPEVRYKRALGCLSGGEMPVLLPHRYLGVVDIVNAVLSSWIWPPLPPKMPSMAEMDIGTLVKEDLTRHWISNGAPRALLTAALVRRLAATGAPINKIIYLYENQPWERALCWQARRSLPNATLVGYQHAGISRFLLNFYLAPGEDSEAPLPDRIVTVGDHTAAILSSDGYGPDRIEVGGALQVQSLLAKTSHPSNSNPAGSYPIILVAASNGQEEATELVDLAANLFGLDDGVQVIVKCHPVMPYETISSILGAKLPQNVQVSYEPIEDLILKSSVMVYSGSTVGVQAIALGLPVVHFRTQFDFDMDPLERMPHLRLEATTLEDLRDKLQWLLENREEYIASHREEWNRMAQEMYAPVTEETYRAFAS